MPYFELKNDEISFPPAYFADIDGLLAVGGTMSVERLLLAYNSGIYYWHYPLKHIKWWSPDPRIVLKPDSFVMTKSEQDTFLKDFDIQVDTRFEEVLRGCQSVFNIQDRMDNNWLTERMVRLFMELHQQGCAHSIEVWQNDDLVGGLFGVAIGKLFFGEYVFAKVERADEVAMVYLIEKLKDQNFDLIDMQKETFLLPGFEYDEMPRLEYVDLCKENARLHPEDYQDFNI
ncbi:leucyl/phenylalanyl-tRNA--protein transferase [Flagellimonas sediminis]|uniref:Leucyl/phenylalanyl-tRNA--protein transferase n=1 Tax=Flagellimonas sediminis TaxID=2696468 RepID=A0A6I5KVB3_9FLAO|nr:leucyl/phenylalanyl-tRNA--protein transferase [Allomuricauda sediminis]NDV44667.1 leucyl/phenylalanyl-tRNA--protein transferase [Allomuricauda sediminis]